MARLLKSEVYLRINAQLWGLRYLDEKQKIYKTQVDELETQHMQILLCGLIGGYYLKAVFRSNLTKKIDRLFNENLVYQRS